MQVSSQSISALIKQVASAPSDMLRQTSGMTSLLRPAETLNHQEGVAGVRRSVADDDFVGSGVQVSLDLSSGQAIRLNIEQGISGNVRDIRLETNAPLNLEDEEKLSRFLMALSESVTTLFSGERGEALFDFVNAPGIGDVELSVQQDKGNIKQRFEFERQVNGYGRKEVDGEWSHYNHLTGQQALHNFALSKQPRDVASAYGQLDYKWVLDQVTAGMAVLGNDYTGGHGQKAQVTDFFLSGVHALFRNSQNGQRLLSELGASPDSSKAFIGKTIQALSHSNRASNNMPGVKVQQGGERAGQINGLGDFKADFSSKQNARGMSNGQDEYNLALSISQVTRSLQGVTDDDTNQTQFRRLLLEYESKREKQSYEYRWQHDEAVINRFVNGALEQTYFKVSDLQQGILTSLDGQRKEISNYMQRREYRADEQNSPRLQHGYILPSVYTEQNHNVQYIT